MAASSADPGENLEPGGRTNEELLTSAIREPRGMSPHRYDLVIMDGEDGGRFDRGAAGAVGGVAARLEGPDRTLVPAGVRDELLITSLNNTTF